MLTLLLLACTGPATTDAPDTGATDSADTSDTVDTEPEVILWAKYKVDTSSTLRGVYSSGQGVYLVGSRGQAWVGSATDAWAAYALPAELVGVDINGLWGNGAAETLQLAVAADNGLVGVLSGGLWTVYTLGAGANLSVDGTSLANLFVVGDNGIQHFDGVAWTVENLPPVTMNGVWAYEGGAFAAGNEGVVMKRADGGTWAESETNKVANFYGISGAGGSDVWVAGDQGVILHWNGTSWTQVESGTTETLNALYVGATDSILAVGNDGVTLKYSGAGWKELANETNQNLYAVHGVSAANAWAVGNGGLAMQYKE
ncbi:MAG: hypothetical protein Q8P41_09710 [Pseudomonadota bacterium]|nr:hypothetical protein [Pseudomonadota bacterium]